MYRIIQKRNLWFIISGIIIIPGIIAMAMGGLKPGIDFTGGSMIEISFGTERPSVAQIQEKIATIPDLGPITIQPLGEKDMSLKLRTIDNDTYQKILQTLQSNFNDVEERSFEAIGPTIGKELRSKSITATILVLVCILLYITFVFRKVSSHRVKSWVYGSGAIIALVHDLFVVVGIFAILGKFFNVEIDSLFISALLTVLGFSVHDTIVVYDRIRERLKLSYNQAYEDTVNDSVNQTLVRSLNTTLTTLLVLIALYLFGGETIKYFIFTLLIGITAGTYSSIFIASPLLVVWDKFLSKKES